MKIENMPELQDLVTFRPNLKHPVHRWFYYKEAFSRDLVNIILKEFRPKTVLDPFCGTGTTLLACAEKGIDSIGFDVNPIAIIASRAKTMIYNTEVLRQEKERVFSEKFSETRLVENRLERYFTKETLKRLVFNKSLANKTKYNDFFLLALANAAYECSNVVRDGAMLRHSSKRFIPIRAVFGRNMETMWRDLKKIKLTGKAHVMEADARKIPLKDHSVDAVITSPPYIGIEDYTRAYAIENFVVGQDIKDWLGKGIQKKEQYMADMLKVLRELKRVCKPKSPMAFVIWDGFVNGEIIDIVQEMSSMAKKAGIGVEKVWIARTKPALVSRTKKVGDLREVVIFLRSRP